MSLGGPTDDTCTPLEKAFLSLQVTVTGFLLLRIQDLSFAIPVSVSNHLIDSELQPRDSHYPGNLLKRDAYQVIQYFIVGAQH